MHEFERNCVDTEESTEGEIGACAKNKLIIFDKKKDFINNNNVEINETILNEELGRAIEQKEVISPTDASVVNGAMAGVWTLKDCWKCVENRGNIWSRNWNKNTPLVGEAAIFLALVSAVEINVRGHEEVKIKTHIDCKKV